MPHFTSLPESWSISAESIEYLTTLAQEQAPGLALEIVVNNPLTAAAQLDIAFQSHNPVLNSYTLSPELILQTKPDFLESLHGLKIDYRETELGQWELEVLAPSLYGADSSRPLIEQIRVFFNQEIAPTLAGHKGGATLESLSEAGVLSLRFYGGCQGCSLSSVTLKNTIRNKLQQRFPEVKEICDLTAHEAGENPYA